MNWADALILASPDYHGSMSGTIKNFLDHFWREFAGKTFAYVCTSHERGLTRHGSDEDSSYDNVMDGVCRMERRLMATMILMKMETLTNLALERRLRMLARDLVIYGRIIREQFQNDLASSEVATFRPSIESKLAQDPDILSDTSRVVFPRTSIANPSDFF